MADPGFLSGFIGKGIDIAINQILHHAGIALHCREELNSLRDLVTSIRPTATQIRQYRLQLNRKRGTSIAQTDDNASQWVNKLHDLLQQALPMVEKCIIPRFDFFSRYQMSRKISGLISEIEKHLKLVPVVLLEQQTQMLMEMRRESAEASSSTSASTSQAPTGSFFIEDALIVGQEQAFDTLEKLVIDAEVKSLFRTGVVGKGGSGKTLLLKRVFNSQKVRELFRDDLLLWLTISESPSFSSLRNELCKQIAVQAKDHEPNMNEEDEKTWLSQRMQAKRFVLFFDDVWGGGRKLLEELGLSRLTEHSNSKIIVSSRNRRALIEMGIADTSPLAMEDLSEEKSWELFAHHAFPYNNGNPPANIDQRRAKLVCDKCGGLPLAIKVIGSTMAGITDAQEWESAILRLPNANSKDHQALHDRLRLSYDALGNYDVNLQLCFLYLAAFIEDEIIYVELYLIPMWIGEGLLERNERCHDPFEMGRIYAKLLADRCLIEPILKDVDGRVLNCRMHDMLRGLAIQIAEQEEKFYCRSGNGLTALVENEYSRCTRLFLKNNKLSSLPNSFRASEICSLLMIDNNELQKIPGKVIGSMISLKVLDLSGTSLESLPKSVGCLKQLACLMLRGVPIKRLPAAVTNLGSLQILDLGRSKITELPSSIHKLTSLRCLKLFDCDDLQCLPRSISRLTSLQYLDIVGCSNVWTKHDKKKAASVNDLGCLTQLKSLRLENGAERISEGTLGSMVQMETLELVDAVMTSLPRDMKNMSKLKMLDLSCDEMVKMDSRFGEFQNLIYLRLWCCDKLEELSDLQKLKGLRQLHICGCSKLKKLPIEFGEKGAFPFLEIFSLVELDELEELPAIIEEEDVMPSLKIFTIMNCEALKMLPENYFHLKTLQKIRVYGCSMVLENIEKIQMKNTQIKLITMSTTDIETIIERYYRMCPKGENWLYHESAYDEHFLFWQDLSRRL